MPPTQAERWFRPAVALTAGVALVWRLVYLFTSGVREQDLFQQGDAFWYSTVAQNLADGSLFRNLFTGEPTADHPPGTVLVLGPAAWLFDGDLTAQRLTMVLLGTVTVVVLALVGRAVAGPVAGIAAGVVAAAHPSLWINDALLMSETPSALVLAVLLLLGVRLAAEPSLRLAVVTGAVCGLAALTRAETGLFLPLMAWPLLARAPGGWRQRATLVAAATAATAVVLLPWFALNLTRFDEPVALSTNDGLTLLGANCDATYDGAVVGGWVIEPCVTDFWATMDDRKPPLDGPVPAGWTCSDRFQLRPPCNDASTVSKQMREEGLSYVRRHLGDLPGVLYARHGRVWGWYRLDQSTAGSVLEGRPRWASWAGYVGTWLVLPAAVAGSVVLRRRRAVLLPFAASLAVVLVVTSAFYGLARFRIPYDVASCVLAGVAVAAALERIRSGAAAAAPSADGPATPTPSPVPSTPR